MVGSLTGAVASQIVTEARDGELRTVGNRPPDPDNGSRLDNTKAKSGISLVDSMAAGAATSKSPTYATRYSHIATAKL